MDEEWIPNCFALDLIPSEGKHKGADIANFFLECIKFYELEHRVGGITLDNASSNTTFIAELGSLLASEGIQFNTEDQHFRCFAHVLHLAVQDLFEAMNVICPQDLATDNDDASVDDEAEYFEDDDNEKEQDLPPIAKIISKIRKTFKKIRRSEELMKKLESWCGASDVKFLKPKIDVKTRWNSTSDMIGTAFHLKPSLNLMWNNSSIRFAIQSGKF